MEYYKDDKEVIENIRRYIAKDDTKSALDSLEKLCKKNHEHSKMVTIWKGNHTRAKNQYYINQNREEYSNNINTIHSNILDICHDITSELETKEAIKTPVTQKEITFQKCSKLDCPLFLNS